MTARWSLVLCMAFAAPVLGTPAVAVAGPAEPEQMSIRVVVEAKLGDAGPAFEDVIAVDLRVAIEEAGYVLDDSVRADAATWNEGDPLVDFDGDPRPGVEGASDFAGADIP